jgi:hypothetical protein
MDPEFPEGSFVECTNNEDFEDALTLGCIYEVLKASYANNYVLIVNNYGNAGRYNKTRFIPVATKGQPSTRRKHKGAKIVIVTRPSA